MASFVMNIGHIRLEYGVAANLNGSDALFVLIFLANIMLLQTPKVYRYFPYQLP